MPRNPWSYIPASLCGGVLLIAGATNQFGPVHTPGASAAYELVTDALGALPFMNGDLMGRDVPPLQPAVDLLNAHQIIQRVYTDTRTGHEFSVVLVHCGDARDLAGHYPPVCYPSAGWVATGSSPAVIESGSRSIPAVSYRFERSSDNPDVPLRTVATSFFVLPGRAEPFVSSMADVEAAARDRRFAFLGAVHVMVVFEGDPDEQTRAELFARVGRVLGTTIDRIAN